MNIFDAARTVLEEIVNGGNRIAYDILNCSDLQFEQGRVVCSYNTDTYGDVITVYPARRFKQDGKSIILDDRLRIAERGELFGYSNLGYERVFEKNK